MFLIVLGGEVGPGDGVSFLKDEWMEMGVLYHQFPNIYAMALDREAR